MYFGNFYCMNRSGVDCLDFVNNGRNFEPKRKQTYPVDMMGDAGASPVVIPKEKPLYTLDELIRQRALDDDQSPLIAYPKTRLGIDDYELFSGKELNGLIDGAAKALMQAGIEPVVRIFLP
jgi:hypothetical protein